MKIQTESSQSPKTIPGWLDIVRQQVDSLRFGVVQIVVHDSQITQIDKTERVRLEKSQSKTP
ncbi:MAG TPA: YezD family protein [Verrucomicrobiae bacterium]|jgi:hypothetical protein